jgi:hypothetical protein
MRRDSGLLFWGIALATAGVVALAIQFGVLSGDLLAEAWRYWPALLIVAGLAIIASRSRAGWAVALVGAIALGALGGSVLAGGGIGFGCAGEPDARTEQGGSFDGAAAELRVDFSCGDLAVGMTDGAGWTLDARHGSGDEPEIAADGASLQLESDAGGAFGVGGSRQEWELTLPNDAMLDLSVDANAASSRLELGGGRFSRVKLGANAGDIRVDLAGASADELDLEANAGSMTLLLDAATTAAGDLGVNAGSIAVCAPNDLALAITIETDNVTFSHDLDESGLQRSGDTWRSADGQPAVELSVEGNASSLSLNDEEACA